MGIKLQFGIFGAPYAFAMTQSLNNASNNILDVLQTMDNKDVANGDKQLFVKKLPNNKVLYSFCVGGGGKPFFTSAGRSGSFFGLAMVVSEYQSTSNEMIYNFLNNIYETAIVGKIISDNGEHRKHMLSAEKFVGEEIEKQINDAAQESFDLLDIKSFEPYAFNGPERQVKFVPNKTTSSMPKKEPESIEPKTIQFDKAIETIKNMGINPKELAQYISQQNQNN